MPAQKAVRIALVMNGGVSLAVWMGGVTHEVDRLRRSGRGTTAADTGSDAWRAFCEAVGLSVVVDYVSGTSAGGLNGAILASAIAKGTAMPDLRELWGDEARLARGKLLRRQPQDRPNSVLDGAFFRDTVAARLDGLQAGRQPQDVTLLVTASALYGSSTAAVDANREPFTAGDHRRVYRFRRRAGACTLRPDGRIEAARMDEFMAHPAELRTAARASAGFPFAFDPTQEPPELHNLNVTHAKGGPSWLVDGGVLDNAPFTPLLDELRDQPVEDPGARWIVYVVPSKQVAPKGFPAGPGSDPPSWPALPGRIWGLSRESDLRDDVIALRREWAASRGAVHPPEVLIGGVESGAPKVDLAATAVGLFQAYLRAKMAAIVDEIADESVGGPGLPLTDDPVSPKMLNDLLGRGLCWIPDAPDQPAREMGDRLAWQWGTGASMRIARWISRDARGVTGRPALPDQVRNEIGVGEERLLALDARLTEIVARAADDGSEAGPICAASDAIVKSGLLPTVLDVMHAIVHAWAEGRRLPDDEAWTRVLSVEVLHSALDWGGANRPPPFAFYLLSPDSRHEGTILGLGAEADPEFTPNWPDYKLYGTRFGHFGGFGARKFRDWDWMWGRLDGALTLGRSLLAMADTKTEAEKKDLLDALLLEILAECEITQAELQPLTASVVAQRPGQLVAQARDSNETDFDGVIDDLGALLANNPLITKEVVRGGAWSRFKAKVRGWVVRRLIDLGKSEAKRLVAKQRV